MTLFAFECRGETYIFEVLFLLDSVCYRYGFEYNLNKIIGEWLFINEGIRKEKMLFVREGDGIEVNEVLLQRGLIMKRIQMITGCFCLCARNWEGRFLKK